MSNWRRRHADFPAPSGGSDASPLYDLRAVESWLAGRGQLPAGSPLDDLRGELRRRPDGAESEAYLNLVVLALERMGANAREELLALQTEALLSAIHAAVRHHAADVPGAATCAEPGKEAEPVLRAVVRGVQESGAVAVLDVLAELPRDEVGVRGAYATPGVLVDLMADLLAEATDAFPETVLDPACGTGSFLVAAAERGASVLAGQDTMTVQAVQAVVRLGVLAPTGKVQVRDGDSLRHDAFPELQADAVLCNPPYGDRDWGHDELAYDARWEYGVPPKGESELAWVQHCLSHLKPGGWALLVLPPGSAERASGRRIRAELVRRGVVQAVIALPAGMAPPLHVGLHLWVVQKPDQEGPETRSVLFLDAAAPDALPEPRPRSPRGRKKTEESGLREAVMRRWRTYVGAPGTFETEPGIARTVNAIDLLDDATDLTPARHTRAATVTVSPRLLAEHIRQVSAELAQATAQLTALNREDTWPAAGEQARTWRTATVADLARGAALALHRAGTVPGRFATRAEREAWQQAAPDRTVVADAAPMLTAADVTAGHPASGYFPESQKAAAIEVLAGDVLLPELLHDTGTGTAVRVADATDAGSLLGPNLWLVRPDPDRLDPWFLAGFLSADENVYSVATGSTLRRIDARRLRVPLLSLAEQQQYGEAFRRLHALTAAGARVAHLANASTRHLRSGLTGGALLPPPLGRTSTP
ncbi:N-6 DNA methylase [Streptomyces sp. ISL-98]|uniref:N-6 DNA methylase n=1 Tax=Streptomyces sp. ISL-98 TaxID=2819192 RepID=UPI0027E57D1E|nr:N-6 DNA methylase [Streptomyces sp. ISL-98]